MVKQKGERSFSEFIRSLKHRNTDFSAFTGLHVTGGMETVDSMVQGGSEEGMEGIEVLEWASFS